jgi:hypothetical protein
MTMRHGGTKQDNAASVPSSKNSAASVRFLCAGAPRQAKNIALALCASHSGRTMVRCRTDAAPPRPHHAFSACLRLSARRPPTLNRETLMNTERISRATRHFSGVLTEAWGRITGDALRAEAGRRIQFATRNELRDAMFTAQSARDMREFLHRNRNWSQPKDRHHA